MSLALAKLLNGPNFNGGTQILMRADGKLDHNIDYGEDLKTDICPDCCSALVKAYRTRNARDKEMTLKLSESLLMTSRERRNEMMELYPDAKVVLVRMDSIKWWNSVAALITLWLSIDPLMDISSTVCERILRFNPSTRRHNRERR